MIVPGWVEPNPLPADSDWDKYYDKFETWLHENYDDDEGGVMGIKISWEDACESEQLLDMYIEMMKEWE